MAVTFDAAATSDNGANEEVLEWEHEVGDVYDRFLAIGVVASLADRVPGTVVPTVDGQDAFLIGVVSLEESSNTDQAVAVFGYVAPAVGPVTVRYEAPANMQWSAAASLSFAGVDQVDPVIDADTDWGEGNPLAISATVAAELAGMVVDFMSQRYIADDEMVPDAGQEQRVVYVPPGSNAQSVWLHASTRPGADGNVSSGWSYEGGFLFAGMLAFSLRPSVWSLAHSDSFDVEGNEPLHGYGDWLRRAEFGGPDFVVSSERGRVVVAGSGGELHMYQGAGVLGDQEVEMVVGLDANDDVVGPSVRINTASGGEANEDGYSMRLRPGSDTVTLHRHEGNVQINLDSGEFDFSAPGDYVARLRATGSNPVLLEGWVNDVKVVEYEDSSESRWETGYPGLMGFCFLPSVPTIDDWKLRVPEEADEDDSIEGDGSATLPALGIAGAGAVQVSGAGAAAMPALGTEATGSVAVQGAGSMALPALGVAGAGAVQVEGAGALALPSLGVAGQGAVDVVGAGVVLMPAMALEGAGAVRVSGTGSLLMPALRVAGEGSVEADTDVVGAGLLALPGLGVAGSGAVLVQGAGAAVLPFLYAGRLPTPATRDFYSTVARRVRLFH